jgi:hypothetical protein
VRHTQHPQDTQVEQRFGHLAHTHHSIPFHSIQFNLNLNFLFKGPMNHVRLKLDHCPQMWILPRMLPWNGKIEGDIKWIKLKMSSQTVTLQ